MAEATHVYIGRKACGCAVAAVVDGYVSKKEIAKDVADFIKRGYDIQRVPIGDDGVKLDRCEHEAAS